MTSEDRLVRRTNRIVKVVPSPPRDVRLDGQRLTWVEPRAANHVTHYLIRVGTDTADPAYKVPVGSTVCSLSNGDSGFWISSYNEATDAESQMVYTAGSANLITELWDVQPIGSVPFIISSVSGDSTVLIVSGLYNPPAEAEGFAGVIGYWQISGKFIFAGECDYDGDITATGITRYGAFRFRTSLPSVAATWGLRLVPKSSSWRGSVSSASPVLTFSVPAAAAVDNGNNAIDNASFEFGLARWFGYSADVITTNSVSKLPSNSLKVIATTTQYVQQPEFAADGNTDVVLANPGDRLEFSGWYQFDAGSTNTDGIARIVCYDASGVETGSSDSPAFDASVTTFSAFSLSLTAPASTKYVRWVPFSGAIGSGALYIDALLGRISSQSNEPNKTPLDYGAAGDGTTDDTTAVAACALANDAWEIPGGYTFVTDALTLTSRSNIRITGTGTLKKRTGSSGTALLILDSCGLARISQVGLDANGAAYCARLTGSSGTEGWFESCDLSNFATDPLDVVAGTGSDYYAYNNSGISDRLNWIAAVAPTGLTVTITATGTDPNRYGINVSTTLPSGTDAEEAVGFEYRASYFKDAGLSGTPQVRSLGMGSASGSFGPYERQLDNNWVRVDVRSYNALNRYSAWYTGSTAVKIDPVPGPSAPTSVTTTISQAAGEYSLDTTVVLPSDPAIVGFRRSAYFFTSAVITTPESVIPLAELSLDLTTLQFLDGPFSADKSDYWVEVGVETLSRDLVASSPTMSARLKINADTSNKGLDGDIRDITFDTSYQDSANGWQGVGLLWRLSSGASGCIDLRARYEPPLDGISPAITTVLKYVQPWVETDIDPLTNDSSLIQGFNDIPYLGNAQGDSEGRKGYIEVYDVPISTATIYLHGLGKSLIGGQEFKRVRSATPPSSVRYMSLTLTSEEVGHTTHHPLAAISGAVVEVEERQIEGGWEGRYKFTFTPPSTDPWYKYTLIRGRWTDSAWVTSQVFDADPGFSPIASPCYSEWWGWPEEDEYHQYRFTPVDQNLVEYTTSAPVVNFFLPGRAKVPVVADATRPANLRMSVETGTSEPYTVLQTSADPNGIKQWYAFVAWDAETATSGRMQLYFAYTLANSSWVATTALKPLGGVSIETGAVDLPAESYAAAATNALMNVYVESQDGKRALCATMRFTIPAGPTGQLDPLQLALTKMGDFQINTDDPLHPFLEITDQGVTNRVKLGARLALDTNNALTTTGLVADWVLAALGAFSSRVLVSNGIGSVDIGATGTITISGPNGTIEMSSGGGVKIMRGSHYVLVESDRITMSAGSASLVLTGGAGSFTGSVNAAGIISSPSGFELWSGGIRLGYWNGTGFAPGVPIAGMLALGSTSSTAAAGDHNHLYSNLAGLPTLGNSASRNVGTSSGTVAHGDHTHGGHTGSLLVNGGLQRLNFTAGILMSIDNLG